MVEPNSGRNNNKCNWIFKQQLQYNQKFSGKEYTAKRNNWKYPLKKINDVIMNNGECVFERFSRSDLGEHQSLVLFVQYNLMFYR